MIRLTKKCEANEFQRMTHNHHNRCTISFFFICTPRTMGTSGQVTITSTIFELCVVVCVLVLSPCLIVFSPIPVFYCLFEPYGIFVGRIYLNLIQFMRCGMLFRRSSIVICSPVCEQTVFKYSMPRTQILRLTFGFSGKFRSLLPHCVRLPALAFWPVRCFSAFRLTNTIWIRHFTNQY